MGNMALTYGVIGDRTPTSLEESLKKTIDYYYKNNKNWDW